MIRNCNAVYVINLSLQFYAIFCTLTLPSGQVTSQLTTFLLRELKNEVNFAAGRKFEIVLSATASIKFRFEAHNKVERREWLARLATKTFSNGCGRVHYYIPGYFSPQFLCLGSKI